jgi:hypothetical protein
LRGDVYKSPLISKSFTNRADAHFLAISFAFSEDAISQGLGYRGKLKITGVEYKLKDKKIYGDSGTLRGVMFYVERKIPKKKL